MIPLKIECSCGQRFAFDVEPVHGRMPAPVACPSCGADGTVVANSLIAQQIATLTPQVVSVPPPLAAAAPFPAPGGARIARAVPVAAPVAVAPSAPVAAASAPRAFQPAGGRPLPQKPRGKDGWSADESSFNKLGMYIVMIPSILAAMLTWGIFGVEVPVMILCIIVGVCGLIGGVVNIMGRGPIWTGAIIGLFMGLGGYGAVSWWIQGRASVYKFEMAIAFAIGAAPGFLLQYLLQVIMRKRAAA
jgi:hypothetical protein